jgi:squalene synthase HpnC
MDYSAITNIAPTAESTHVGIKLPATVKAAFEPPCPIDSAQRYTRQLALGHYENFSVISLVLPRHLRQDFSNIYAFCRTADDLSDEVPDRSLALKYLGRFKALTRTCYQGNPGSPLFVALRETITKFDIPIEPFLDLIDAFEQDQGVNRYDTFDQLVDYCRRSADPVGRLVLYMCGYRDTERQRLSDRTCTALQLANFWQDIRRDILDRDRIYIPRESMRKFGVTEDQIVEGRCDEHFREMMRFEVNRTASLFNEGDRLLPMLNSSVQRQVKLFGEGGKAVLEAIRRQNYDTLGRRPVISGWKKGELIARAMAGGIAARFVRRPG